MEYKIINNNYSFIKLITLIAVFLVVILLGYPVSDYQNGGDIDNLYQEFFIQECSFNGFSFNRFQEYFEPVIHVINILAPCMDVKAYTYYLGLTILVLKLIVAYSFRSIVAGFIYLIVSTLFLDLFTSVHIYRQIFATYLILISIIYNKKLLIIISLLTHNAGWLISLFFIKSSEIYTKRKKFLILLLIILSIAFILFHENIFTRYGFIVSDRKITVEGTFVIQLLKYFIISLIIGVFEFCIFKRLDLLFLGLNGITVIGLGIIFDINGEFIFRILLPLKFVILPYFLSIFITKFNVFKFSKI